MLARGAAEGAEKWRVHHRGTGHRGGAAWLRCARLSAAPREIKASHALPRATPHPNPVPIGRGGRVRTPLLSFDFLVVMPGLDPGIQSASGGGLDRRVEPGDDRKYAAADGISCALPRATPHPNPLPQGERGQLRTAVPWHGGPALSFHNVQQRNCAFVGARGQYRNCHLWCQVRCGAAMADRAAGLRRGGAARRRCRTRRCGAIPRCDGSAGRRGDRRAMPC